MNEDEVFEANKDAILGVLSGIVLATRYQGRQWVSLEEIEAVASLIRNSTREQVYGALDNPQDMGLSEQSIEDLLKNLGD